MSEELRQNSALVNHIDKVDQGVLRELLSVLMNNKRITDRNVKWGVVTEKYSLQSDELAKYLNFFVEPIQQHDTTNLLASLKEVVHSQMPIQVTNDYEFDIVLEAWNAYRNKIQWNQIHIYDDMITIHTDQQSFHFPKQSFVQEFSFPETKENIVYVYESMQKYDYGHKTLDVPYVTQHGIRHLAHNKNQEVFLHRKILDR